MPTIPVPAMTDEVTFTAADGTRIRLVDVELVEVVDEPFDLTLIIRPLTRLQVFAPTETPIFRALAVERGFTL